MINNPPQFEDKGRALKATGFLLSDAMSQLDQLAAQRMKGNDSGGYAQKELKNIAKDLELAYEANPDGYIKVICDVFEKAKPPADSLVRNKVRRNVVRLVHPGTIVREMMKQRMLTAERIASAVKMELPDFEALLDGKRDLNEELAKELARVLGRSSREWMKLQTDYDANKPKQPQA